MSYANPQIQTFSNEGIFQNLQQTISAVTGNLANTLVSQANEERRAKEKAAEKLDNWNTSLVSKTQMLGGKISDVSKNSKIPIDLNVISQITKSKYLDLGSELGPGKDKTKAAKAMQGMENINNYPDRVTNLLALVATETENYRKGAKDGNLTTSFKTKKPKFTGAIGALAYLDVSGAEISMEVDKLDYTNPALNIKYKDENGEWKVQQITNDDALSWKNSGGFVKFIPNATSTVENIQKKTPNVYESITAQGKNGENVNDLTGRIAKDFLIPGARTIPEEQDIVVEGKTVKKTVGLMVQDINIEKISEDPVFEASIDAAARGIFEVDPWEAYSMNEDVFLKQMPKKGIIDLKEPIFEGSTAAQDKADWIRDFKANLKTYQIETLKLKPYQPVLNMDGKTATATWEAPGLAPDAKKTNAKTPRGGVSAEQAGIWDGKIQTVIDKKDGVLPGTYNRQVVIKDGKGELQKYNSTTYSWDVLRTSDDIFGLAEQAGTYSVKPSLTRKNK